MQVFFKAILFFHSFCRSSITFQLSVRTDMGRGLLSQMRTDWRGQVEAGGLKLAEMCRRLSWMTS